MVETLPYRCGALAGALQRGVDLKVVDARDVDFTLPQANRRRHLIGRASEIQPVLRRRSIIISSGQRTPTNRTGNPLRRRAQSARMPRGME